MNRPTLRSCIALFLLLGCLCLGPRTTRSATSPKPAAPTPVSGQLVEPNGKWTNLQAGKWSIPGKWFYHVPPDGHPLSLPLECKDRSEIFAWLEHEVPDGQLYGVECHDPRWCLIVFPMKHMNMAYATSYLFFERISFASSEPKPWRLRWIRFDRMAPDLRNPSSWSAQLKPDLQTLVFRETSGTELFNFVLPEKLKVTHVQ